MEGKYGKKKRMSQVRLDAVKTLVNAGLNNREVAGALGLSTPTVYRAKAANYDFNAYIATVRDNYPLGRPAKADLNETDTSGPKVPVPTEIRKTPSDTFLLMEIKGLLRQIVENTRAPKRGIFK